MSKSYSPFSQMSLAALARKLKATGPDEEFLEFLSQTDVAALQARVRENLRAPSYLRALRLRDIKLWMVASLLLGPVAWVASTFAGPLIQLLAVSLTLALLELARRTVRTATQTEVWPQQVLELALAPLHLSPLKLRALELASQSDAACREYCSTVEQHGRELLGVDYHLWDLKLKGALSATGPSVIARPYPPKPRTAGHKTLRTRTPAPALTEPPPAAPAVYVWRNSQMAV